MCRELRLDELALPFAGELMAVRPAEADWEGAAERLLRGFALSVLVPEQHYAAVSDWIDTHHLKARVVYYRVPDPARERPIPAPDWSPRALAAKLDIRDTPFAPWLERELARRADFECVELARRCGRALIACAPNIQRHMPIKNAQNASGKRPRSLRPSRASTHSSQKVLRGYVLQQRYRG